VVVVVVVVLVPRIERVQQQQQQQVVPAASCNAGNCRVSATRLHTQPAA
jgi:hypothetical protein